VTDVCFVEGDLCGVILLVLVEEGLAVGGEADICDEDTAAFGVELLGEGEIEAWSC
jgi:hypothetical protein